MSIGSNIPLFVENKMYDRTASLRDGGVVEKTIVFTGAAQKGLSGSAIPLFIVTGRVRVRVTGFCTVSLDSTGAPTLEVGISGNTAALIAQTTAKGIDANMVWNDASPGTVQVDSSKQIIAAGADIIGTVGVADIESGAITFVCEWEAISEDDVNNNVVAA